MWSNRLDIRAVELFKANGREGMFIKVRNSFDHSCQFELLWLPDDVKYEQAQQYADADKMIGPVCQNATQKPRYLLRVFPN